jgi:hypothetical protein
MVVRVRGSSSASTVFGLRVRGWRVWALRPPRHWSRDWYFYFYFYFFLCDAWLWGRRWTGVHDVTLWVEFVRGWVG